MYEAMAERKKVTLTIAWIDDFIDEWMKDWTKDAMPKKRMQDMDAWMTKVLTGKDWSGWGMQEWMD